jgi:AbrB family looped-hinge helix DNA binding protein
LYYPYQSHLKGDAMSAVLKPKSAFSTRSATRAATTSAAPEPKLELAATVTSKGQITLPVALRERLGIAAGTKIKFIHDATGTRMEAEKPISAYRGILKHLTLPDDIAVIPKEPDRNFDYITNGIDKTIDSAHLHRLAEGLKK